MGLYDRDWYKDEVRKKKNLGRHKKHRSTISHYAPWILAILSPVVTYHLSPTFQYKVDTVWANAKAMHSKIAQAKATTPPSTQYQQRPQTIQSSSVAQPNVTPRPYQEPNFYQQPDTHSQIRERKTRDYAEENRRLLAELEQIDRACAWWKKQSHDYDLETIRTNVDRYCRR
jgi:hypothetical protein